MQIPAHVLSAISNAAIKYERIKDQEFMFLSENRKSQYPISSQKIHFGVKNFPHLIAMAPRKCSYDEFFTKCKNRTLTYEDFVFSSTHTIDDVFEKAVNLGDFLDFKHIKMFKYGSNKNENNKNAQTKTNKFNFGVGTYKGIIGYIKEGNVHKPKTTLIGNIDKLLPVNEPIVAVLTKKYNMDKYNEIFSELYQGKYAEVSHSLNTNTLNLIDIPNMDKQYKLNIIKLIDSSLNDILPKDVFDKNLITTHENLRLVFKNAVLSNVDEISKWLNSEIGDQQSTTLLLTTSVDEIIYTRQISNAINESTNVINFELTKDTNRIGFSVKSAKPSLEKKDLIQHLAEGYIAIEVKTLESMANVTEKDFEKYFKADYILISEVENPFVIVKEEDLHKIPVQIPNLDEIITNMSVPEENKEVKNYNLHKDEEPSLD